MTKHYVDDAANEAARAARHLSTACRVARRGALRKRAGLLGATLFSVLVGIYYGAPALYAYADEKAPQSRQVPLALARALGRHVGLEASALVVAAAAAIGLLWVYVPRRIERRALADARATEATGRHLRLLGGEWQVFCDATVAGQRLEHVLVGPGGVLVISSRHNRPDLAYDGDLLRRLVSQGGEIACALQCPEWQRPSVRSVLVAWRRGGRPARLQVSGAVVELVGGRHLLAWLLAQRGLEPGSVEASQTIASRALGAQVPDRVPAGWA